METIEEAVTKDNEDENLFAMVLGYRKEYIDVI